MSTLGSSPPGQSISNPDLTATDELANFVSSRKRKQFEQRDVDANTWLLEHGTGGLQELLQNTVKQVLSAELAQITDSLKNITAAVQVITNDNTAIKATLREVNCRLGEIDKSLNYCDERQNEFDNRLKLLEGKCTQSTQHDTQIQALNATIAALEQQARQCNMEISNLPEKKSENLLTLMERLSHEINYPIASSNIVSIHRVPHADRENSRPKNIIVKFATRVMRDNVIAAFRAKKGVNSSKLGVSGQPYTIYCNEHLTLANKILFRQCRELASEKKHRFVWIKHGTILTRKSETSPVIAIRHYDDLKKIT